MEELVIERGRADRHYWRDLWHYRELLYFLAQRDMLVRYKQTVIGVLWAVLRPALTMGVFVAFRRMTGVGASSVPDGLLVFAALLPWQFFSTALTEAANSLVGNSNLISKVYFPRILVPAAAVATSLVDFGVTLGFLGLLMAWYGFAPGWQILALPLLLLQVCGLSAGLGLLLAALNVEFRDFRYVVPFLVQFGVFVSPIAVETGKLPERWQMALALNPMTGIIEGFRWSLLAGKTTPAPVAVWISIGVSVVLLWAGVRYFRKTERGFADVI
jgi:lipopolysaccharide transport system permease protein